ncbi:MAG: hypothetical protein LQ342_006822 [Letrouitia transgressa]|nr:MAG: hypothetical protein LQ342_006822 [Letrouitia transgressa]
MAGFISVLLLSAAGPAGTRAFNQVPAPILDLERLPPATHPQRPSHWLAETRNFAARASRRASSATRRSSSRRPTIGAPSDFRRVELPSDRVPSFRPLQLSIYLPGNELPELPDFSADPNNNNGGLEYPPQALIKSRSDSMLSRPSTAFTIPRKPVPSTRTFSLDESRYSMESRYTFNESPTIAGSRSTIRRPSYAASQSTADFLDALDSRLPQTPPALRSKPGPEPVYTLYRRASEQSLRLRTHLEERQQIERRLPECDTIHEERLPETSKVMGLSPILDNDETSPVSDILGERRDEGISHLKCHSRCNTSHSLTSTTNANRSPLSGVAQSTIAPKLSRRSIISQWLLRSVGPQASPTYVSHPSIQPIESSCSSHQPCYLRDRSSTGSSTAYSQSTMDGSNLPTTSCPLTPKSEAAPMYQLGGLAGRKSFDMDKMPTMVDVQENGIMGIAF